MTGQIEIARAPSQNSKPDWAAIRAQFPTTQRLHYIDVARKAILPRAVERAMRGWLDDVYVSGGADAFSMTAIELTRATVARVFGATASNLALIKNTSEGMNIIAQGFDGLKEGDNIVLSVAEHENNTFPWRHAARQRGVELRFVVPGEKGRVTVDDYRALADSRTRIISCAWVSYGTGFRADIPALAQFCREIGAKLVVDGVQAIGIINQRVDALGADAVVAGGHKAQFSLAGAGLLYMSSEMIGRTTPPYAAKFSYTSNDRTQETPILAPDAHRFDYGNPNFLGCCVQRHGAEFIESIGLAHIEARVRELTTMLMERAKSRGVGLRTPDDWSERAGIVSFLAPGDAEGDARALLGQGYVISVKDGHLRAAAHFYNSPDEIEAFVDALAVRIG